MAGSQHPPSHPCIALIEPRRLVRLGEPKPDPQRIPDKEKLISEPRTDPSTLTYQAWVSDEFPGQPEKGLFEVVVGFGGDIVVLKILLAVESDGLGLHLSLFDIDFVAAKDDWNLLADADKVTWDRISRTPSRLTARTYDASWGRSCR